MTAKSCCYCAICSKHKNNRIHSWDAGVHTHEFVAAPVPVGMTVCLKCPGLHPAGYKCGTVTK